jgi:hypothetical protein
MQDAERVGGVEAIGDLDAEVEHLADFQRPALDHLIERLALEQLHGDELRTVVLVDLVDRADVRMVQRRGGPRLAQEAIQRVLIVCAIRWQEFQRHLARQAEVFRLVDDAHPTGAERLQHPVVCDRLLDHRYRNPSHLNYKQA